MAFLGLSPAAWAVFLPACFALNLSPGPNNILALVNGARYGVARGAFAATGRIAPFAVMIVLTAAGLGALIAASASAFTVLKLVGAAYLVYVGVKLFLAPPPNLAADRANAPLRRLFLRDFTIALTNPKAMLIFTAILPQFIAADEPFLEKFMVLGCVFLLLEVVASSLYALFGALAARAGATPQRLQMLNRLCGGALVLAGGALALARR